MVQIIVGISIVIGTVLLLGPMGLLLLIPIALLAGKMFAEVSEKDKQHARNVDEALSGFFGRK